MAIASHNDAAMLAEGIDAFWRVWPMRTFHVTRERVVDRRRTDCATGRATPRASVETEPFSSARILKYADVCPSQTAPAPVVNSLSCWSVIATQTRSSWGSRGAASSSHRRSRARSARRSSSGSRAASARPTRRHDDRRGVRGRRGRAQPRFIAELAAAPHRGGHRGRDRGLEDRAGGVGHARRAGGRPPTAASSSWSTTGSPPAPPCARPPDRSRPAARRDSSCGAGLPVRRPRGARGRLRPRRLPAVAGPPGRAGRCYRDFWPVSEAVVAAIMTEREREQLDETDAAEREPTSTPSGRARPRRARSGGGT